MHRTLIIALMGWGFVSVPRLDGSGRFCAVSGLVGSWVCGELWCSYLLGR